MRRRALAGFDTVITTVAPPRPAVVAYADLMLTRARASFSATRASEPGLLLSRLENATSSTKRTRAFRSARLARVGLFTTMRIFPRPAASAAESERMLTFASARARPMPARTPVLDRSDRTSWVVLGIVRLLLLPR